RQRLQRTDRAIDSATEMPSGTRRGFCRRRKVPRKPVRESIRARASTLPPRRRRRSRGCLLAEVARQPSANKEQRLRIYESENFSGDADDVDLASAGQRLELVDSTAALAEQSQEAVRSAHVSGACNHEIDLTASKILFDFRNPVLVTRNDEPLIKRRKIAIGLAHSICNQIDIAPAPICGHARAAAIFSTGIDEE